MVRFLIQTSHFSKNLNIFVGNDLVLQCYDPNFVHVNYYGFTGPLNQQTLLSGIVKSNTLIFSTAT
jgi:hypothetical protein